MKIEIERDVVQNALEALQYAHATNRYENTRQDKAIKELRKALAYPTEKAETLLMAFDGAPFVHAQGCLSGVSVTRQAQQAPGKEWRRTHYPICAECERATVPMADTCGWVCDGTKTNGSFSPVKPAP